VGRTVVIITMPLDCSYLMGPSVQRGKLIENTYIFARSLSTVLWIREVLVGTCFRSTVQRAETRRNMKGSMNTDRT
jgi:hypothetical protein